MHLKDTFNKWVQPQNRSEEEAEMIIIEQYLQVLAPELQTWIKEHNPDSAAKAVQSFQMCLLQHEDEVSPGLTINGKHSNTPIDPVRDLYHP